MATNSHRATLAWRATAAAAALICLAATPARADLVSPVTVSLVAPGGIVGDPTPINATDSATVAGGIVVGDGSTIGGFMLPGESLLFSGNAIVLHVAAGVGDTSTNTPYATGYLGLGGQHARYEFKGLQILGQIITGYAYSVPAGISGDSVSLVSDSQLNFNLDTLVFDPALARRDANGYYFADFTIDLLTQPVVNPPDNNVPEPSSWALGLGALAALALSTRRRPVRPAA